MATPEAPQDSFAERERQELLELLAAEASRESLNAPIPRRSSSHPAPLGSAQEPLWFLNQLNPGNLAYQIMTVVRLRGPLHIPWLEKALSLCVERHEGLRTVFRSRGGRPIQVVLPASPIRLEFRQVEGATEDERVETMKRWMAESVAKPISLEEGPVFRAELHRLGSEDHALALLSHHIAVDGSSLAIVGREISSIYQAMSAGQAPALPAVALQPSDFAAWEEGWQKSVAFQEQLQHWKTVLSGELPVIELPTDRSRPARQSLNGAHHSWRLSSSDLSALRQVCQRERVTAFTGLLTVFVVLLHRWSRNDQVLIGCASSGRHRPGLESLVGMLVNMLVIRSELQGDPPFTTLLREMGDHVRQAFEHQEVPFERVVQSLQPKRSSSHSPIFQIAFSHLSAEGSDWELPGLNVTHVPVAVTGAKFDLMLNIFETSEGAHASIEYSTDLFEVSTIRRMAESLDVLLGAFAINPGQSVRSPAWMSGAAQHQILVKWNQTQREPSRSRTLHELFEAQAEQTPEACAVVAGRQRCTYRELNERASRIARTLREAGVERESRVALCCQRSIEMVAAVLGILKSGGAYVALDPEYPADRLSFMLQDCQASVLLTQASLRSRLPAHSAREIGVEDALSSAAAMQMRPASDSDEADLAYMIYTSGSTGTPKGVLIEHRNAVAFVAWALESFSGEETSGVLFSTSLCFDLSVFELFVTLSAGGQVIVAENALAIASLPSAHEVTLINTVPSAIAELVRQQALPASVRTINLAGELLKTEWVDRLYALPQVKAVNDLYGPSECTTYSTWTRRRPGAPPTIGRPIANTQVYILDPLRQPVPVGVPGEIYLGGAGVARGYFNRPELTAERFVTHPFSAEPGARLYRTGDLGRFREDGNVEFLGRMDRQVKVRGFRIELGEIEAVLSRHPRVKDAAVELRETREGETQVVAFLESDESTPPLADELKTFVRKVLPSSMVPSVFMCGIVLPRTLNGKVDRRALSKFEEGGGGRNVDRVPPRTEFERTIATLWSEVLKVEGIGIHDDFFALGGHSLNATRLVHRVGECLGRPVRVRTLFDAPTLAEFAAAVERG